MVARAANKRLENVEKARRQHGVSFLAAFADLDMLDHIYVLSMEAILRRVIFLTRKLEHKQWSAHTIAISTASRSGRLPRHSGLLEASQGSWPKPSV